MPEPLTSDLDAATPLRRTGTARCRRVLPALITLLAAMPSAFSAQDGHAWTNYANPRFGVAICYPADLVRRQRAPDNGDGLAFVSPDGGRIAVWSSFNTMGTTLEASAQEDEQRLAGSSGRVSYRLVRPGFIVLSGEREGKGEVFYNRTALSGDTVSTVEITYPASRKHIWDAITARVNRCFKPGRG